MNLCSRWSIHREMTLVPYRARLAPRRVVAAPSGAQPYAPMIFALYTLGLRYCHVAAMRWEKLTSDGVIAIEETYDVSANVFSPVDQQKKAPPVIALEPRTLDLVRWHRHYLTRRNHPGIKTMRQASIALMQSVPSGPVAGSKSRAKVGTEAVGDGNRMMNWLWPPNLSCRAT
jgi:hypothetical protein